MIKPKESDASNVICSPWSNVIEIYNGSSMNALTMGSLLHNTLTCVVGGDMVGCNDGTSVVGWTCGWCVGRIIVGLGVGSGVGYDDGYLDGFRDGLWVGSGVGADWITNYYFDIIFCLYFKIWSWFGLCFVSLLIKIVWWFKDLDQSVTLT